MEPVTSTTATAQDRTAAAPGTRIPPPRSFPPGGQEPSASVVICTYTQARWSLLRRAVDSVQAQTHPPRQVLVCVDHNPALADRCRALWPGTGDGDTGGDTGGVAVQVLENRYPGRLGSARNTALEAVTADVVAFLDDDAAAEPTWLATLLRVYREDGAAVAVGGAPLPVFQTRLPVWFPEQFHWVFGCHWRGMPERLGPARHLIGASMSARAEALRGVGGFHADDHDDMDLSHRLAAAHGAGAVLYEPEARVHHFVPAERLTWRYFRRRCYGVNREKVRALRDLGEAGNLTAELQFAAAAVRTSVGAVGAAVRGRPVELLRAGALLAGLGLAGLGHLHGRAAMLAGRTPPARTRGLRASTGAGAA
ncbi:glycosyltransferase family 2 protein [Kineococcus sp. SYSU DK003]|uniref:glycosyltransferase family 2 protein n=1 Tax=Kineococcus sp. SYSU DK003 TaxID=3383124 RepID=UPI003D7D314B